jgi:hypothetical protein
MRFRQVVDEDRFGCGQFPRLRAEERGQVGKIALSCSRGRETMPAPESRMSEIFRTPPARLTRRRRAFVRQDHPLAQPPV